MAASREEVFERVKEVLSEQLGIEDAEITEEAHFQEDLDADSLDLVELIMELEDAVAQVLESLVRGLAVGGPVRVRKDELVAVGRKAVDQPLELAGCAWPTGATRRSRRPDRRS